MKYLYIFHSISKIWIILTFYKNVNSNMLSLLDTLYNKKFIITKNKAKSKNLKCSKTKKSEIIIPSIYVKDRLIKTMTNTTSPPPSQHIVRGVLYISHFTLAINNSKPCIVFYYLTH